MKQARRQLQDLPLASTALAGLLLCAASAQADTYTDNFTLTTSNQTLFANASGWNVDTGFQGAQWSATVGGDNYVDPCTDLGPFGSICLGTTGGGVSIKSAGQIGFSANATGSFGKVTASVPYTTTLTMTPNTGANGQFSIGSTYTLLGGSTLTTTAPVLQASLNGIMNMQNQFSAGVCVAGGCSNSSSNLDMNAGTFNILSAGTSGSAPLTTFGQPLSGFKYGTTYDLRSPSAKGGTLPPSIGNVVVNQLQGGSASSKTAGVLPTWSSNQVMTAANVNLTGLLETATGLGSSPNIVKSVLTPEIKLGSIADVKGTMVTAQLGAQIDLKQQLQLQPDLEVTMVFSAPVYQRVVFNHGRSSSLIDLGTTVTMKAGVTESLTFNGAAGQLLSWSYGMGSATIDASADLTINPQLSVQAACFSADVFNTFSTNVPCAYNNHSVLANLIDVPLQKAANAAITGWNSASFNAPLAAVPEPGSWALFGLGLTGIAWARRRGASAA